MSAWTNAYWPRSGRPRVDVRGRGARAGRARGAAARAPRSLPGHRRRAPASVKLWPRTAASWRSARSAGVEGVEARGDERLERLRARPGSPRSPTGSVAAVGLARGGRRRRASGRSRRRTAGCRRRGRRSRATARSGSPGTRPASSSRIAVVGERLEARAPTKLRRPAPQSGPPLEQLRPGQRDDRGSGRRGSTRAGGR